MENALLEALASLLATDNGWHYHLTDVYPQDVVGVFLRDAPSTHPTALWLASYPVDHAVSGTDSTIGVQVRVRASSPDTCNDLADKSFRSLHGRWAETLGSVRVEQLLWRSASPLGPNAQGLYERVDNYYADISNPAPHRI